MYQEVCCSNISSGIIKDMKFDLRSKWRKVVSLKLNTSCYQGLMKKFNTNSTQAWSIENYNFRNLISEIRLIMTWMVRVSLSTTLVIYKVYFKIHQVQKQRLRTHILCVKLMCLYALEFCNQVLPDFHHLWSEEFCSQHNQSSCWS